MNVQKVAFPTIHSDFLEFHFYFTLRLTLLALLYLIIEYIKCVQRYLSILYSLYFFFPMCRIFVIFSILPIIWILTRFLPFCFYLFLSVRWSIPDQNNHRNRYSVRFINFFICKLQCNFNGFIPLAATSLKSLEESRKFICIMCPFRGGLKKFRIETGIISVAGDLHKD
jgi:hypothetical protein